MSSCSTLDAILMFIKKRLQQYGFFNVSFINTVSSRWKCHRQTIIVLYLIEVYVRRAQLTMEEVTTHFHLIKNGHIPELSEEWTLYVGRAEGLHFPADVLDGLAAFKQIKNSFPACYELLQRHQQGQTHLFEISNNLF